jgi:hypothetical protein
MRGKNRKVRKDRESQRGLNNDNTTRLIISVDLGISSSSTYYLPTISSPLSWRAFLACGTVSAVVLEEVRFVRLLCMRKPDLNLLGLYFYIQKYLRKPDLFQPYSAAPTDGIPLFLAGNGHAPELWGVFGASFISIPESIVRSVPCLLRQSLLPPPR